MDIAEIGAELHGYAEDIRRATGTPGGVIEISDGSETAEVACGWGDLARREPMTAGLAFPGGSLSKIYISLAVALLVERGTLDVNAPLTKYIEVANPLGGDPLTVAHLLTHRAGLALDTYDAVIGTSQDEAMALVEELYGPEYGQVRQRWVAPAGEAFAYSSLGLALVAAVIEQLAGVPFATFVADEIAAPARLVATSWPGGPGWGRGERMTGYMGFGDHAVPTPVIGSRCASSTGVVTTVGDQNRLMTHLLGGEGALLRPETLRWLTTPQVEYTFMGRPVGMHLGAGIQLRDVGKREFAVGHNAAYPFGWWSVSWTYPELGLVVTAAGNRWDMRQYMEIEPTWAWQVAREAARLRAGGAPRHPGGRSRSYVAGMVTGGRLHGLLGVGQGIGENELTEMIAGTRRVGRGEPWTGEDFADGLRMMESAHTPDEIRARVAAEGGLASAVDLTALAWGERRGGSMMVIRDYA
ncbi:serine hydrolase domain-containing protein [Streptosporangium vulgare]|uniref:Serine hydrolase domain-containing protein n=1 Tax=Streptosporangium vulgare TaxID=46190 RepID=A0ABV5TM12_9ACTN